jgi:tRNA dimethylallyltransferase
MTKVVAIVGPTAVGKTALSISVAKDLGGEVISGDSMQVYRGLDIGTAKATVQERAGVAHHLIDVRDVNERFSVADFKEEADQKISQIEQRGKLPLIVGGTGFYLQALVENLALGRDQFDAESAQIRSHWHQVADQQGKQYVWDQLAVRDPRAAEKIPVANLRRVIRALEVIEKTGELFSAQPQAPAKNEFLIIGLTTQRPVLYQRINQRVDQMVKEGLLDEARWLYQQGGTAFQSGKGIGYRELFPYFEGKITQEAAVEKIKLDSRHYAKRQLTWFRNQMTVHWFDLVSRQNTTEEIEALISDWLKK